ncbi:LOW QUALITY PROTEIN: WPP domain-associated protein-like [Salvia hispanica]|uniref:LOW QUALITY PROTEIN: WPP domain-associated protein-like n=1 Tax=Salvia hispanica TaxID=49212 RepID=UPI0020093E10|nr:LOW QUALITY PROTEIN: WPP domain-associated protein-like [Salvia hispanica]
MEGGEVMVNGGTSNGYGCGVPCGNGLGKLCSENGLERVYSENGSRGTSVLEDGNGNLADVVLEDWENYWEDISDRLMISRLVSDSVIKGMVTAVEQDCAERIATNELEMTSLKERLQSYEVDLGKYEDVRLPMGHKEYDIGKSSCSACVCLNRESVREELNSLRNLAREQFKKAEKDIECATRSNLAKKTSSGTELVGLGGILHEKHSESWVDVNKTLQCLNTTFDGVCKKVDDILIRSNISFCESQQGDKLLTEVENVVTQTLFRSPREEFEEKLEKDYKLCGIQDMKWLEKFNDVASLGTKLEAIQKSLSMPESELVSHGSNDLDNFHPKAFGNHVTRPTSLYGENGTVDEPNVHVAESYDFQQLKHMSKEELVTYFSNIITKIKRDNESDLHQMTDKYYSLKREYLKMKGSFVANMKYEEFDALRKKIAQVSSKLESFLSENEQFPALTKSLQSRENMKHRLESLLSENRHLRGCLIDKGNEVKSLKEQVSSVASEILQHSLAEQNLLRLVESLRSALKESCIKASLSEEIYKSVLREQIAQTRCRSEYLDMELLITRDIILREAAIPVETASKHGIEDSDIETLLMQGFNALLFTEIIRDLRQQLDNLNQKVLINEEKVACLERKSLEKENELLLEVEEKEKLKQEIQDLRLAKEDKEKLAMDLSLALSKEREQFELALTDLITVREDASRQQMLVTESNRNLESLRLKHLEALDQIEVCKSEISKLDQKLSQTEAVLTKAEIERTATFTHIQELHDKLSLSEARELTIKKEMEWAANRFSKLSSEFEWRVSGAIKSTNSRLEDANSHLKAITEMANELRRSELLYKQKLERGNTDLKMAESEVDLLGDEVDTLLRLLEKIYIALDHYSPVLKHYPGVIEILELVKRELSGESTRMS